MAVDGSMPLAEAKSCRAYDTYRLLASMVTFRTHAAVLLSTVRLSNPIPLRSVTISPRADNLRCWVIAVVRGCLPDISAVGVASDYKAACLPIFKLISGSVHTAVWPTLQVRDRLPEASDTKTRNKLTQLLQYASRGLQARRVNPTTLNHKLEETNCILFRLDKPTNIC